MNDQTMIQAALGQAADAGRATDTTLAHLTLGEVVIPREVMEDPEAAQAVQAVFQAYGINIREFTVGDPANKVNPETGYPEFFSLKKIFKKIAPIALPILGTMIPGVGPVLGAALGGALGGGISGGGIKGILTGAALGGGGAALSGALGGAGGILGKTAGTSLAGTTGNALLQGPTQGTGILGAMTRGLGTGGATGGLGGISSYAKPAASIFSGIMQSNDQDEMEKQLLAAQGRAESAMQPYSDIGLKAQNQLSENLTSGFDTSNLYDDPGYQYRLSEGQKALDAALNAQGMGQSGGAILEAQKQAQGMAAQQYDTAYNQWLQKNNQLAGVGGSGQVAAGSLADIYGNQGNIQANKTLEQGNILSRTIAGLMGGRSIIGYDKNGSPIYA